LSAYPHILIIQLL